MKEKIIKYSIKYHKQLSAFLNWCVKKKYITYNPAREIGNIKK